ncbi:hypothetical protein Bbelb_206110 [Branchiostoma belcheri]|nr:hypothetical protein Bbelb_206110 [Branchiostoma belcheri]
MAVSLSFPLSLGRRKLRADLATGKVAGRCLSYRTASLVAALLSPPCVRCENPARNVSLPRLATIAGRCVTSAVVPNGATPYKEPGGHSAKAQGLSRGSQACGSAQERGIAGGHVLMGGRGIN